MFPTRTLTRTFGAALAALVLLAGGAMPAASQASPFTTYGLGLEPGVVVEVFVKGKSCGTATVNAAGEWGPVYAGTEQCPAASGDEITFTLDGQVANETATFVTGGAPEDVQQGISLTAVEKPEAPEKPELPSLGDLPASGVALVVSPGGKPEVLRQAAAASGCGVVSMWVSTASGAFVGYSFGAPSFVNQAFVNTHPDGLSQGSIVILVCDPAALKP